MAKKTSEDEHGGATTVGKWKVGQVAFFRPKLYGYRLWTQGKIWCFDMDAKCKDTSWAMMTPCGPGWGKKTSAGSSWCIRVEDLHKKEIKADDKRAKKQELYTTKRNKRRKKKK